MLLPPSEVQLTIGAQALVEDSAPSSSGVAEAASLSQSSASPPPARAPWRRVVADFAYLSLVTTGWMVGNLLGVLGCVIAFFIVLSAGQWDAFFFQVDNLTSRYLDADVVRRAAFVHGLAQAFILLFTAVILLRAPFFVQRLRTELARETVS
jgi:hypothetical protein